MEDAGPTKPDISIKKPFYRKRWFFCTLAWSIFGVVVVLGIILAVIFIGFYHDAGFCCYGFPAPICLASTQLCPATPITPCNHSNASSCCTMSNSSYSYCSDVPPENRTSQCTAVCLSAPGSSAWLLMSSSDCHDMCNNFVSSRPLPNVATSYRSQLEFAQNISASCFYQSENYFDFSGVPPESPSNPSTPRLPSDYLDGSYESDDR